MVVEIDGVKYVPDNSQVTDRAMGLLREVYSALWIEGCYDGRTEELAKFAKPLAVKMMEINKELGFKK